jgi:hypothetical protein
MIEYILNSDDEIETAILDLAVGELMRTYSVGCSGISIYLDDSNINKDKPNNIIVVNPLYKNENLFILSRKGDLKHIVFLNGSDSEEIKLGNFRYRINKNRSFPDRLNNILPDYLK